MSQNQDDIDLQNNPKSTTPRDNYLSTGNSTGNSDDYGSPTSTENLEKDDGAAIEMKDVTHEPVSISEKPQRSAPVALALGFVLVILGMANGVNFISSGVPAPIALREQMVFKVWIVMKMFISSVGSSMICQALYRLYNEKHFEKSRYYQQSSVGYPRAIIGCAILGVGMALAGSGPTMIPAQVGSGILTGPYCLAGGMVAAFIFIIIEPYVFKTDLCRKPEEVTTLDGFFNIPYHKLAIPLGIMMIVCSIVLEAIFTQAEDYPKLHLGPRTHMNYPTVTGVVHGIMQIPVRIISGDGHGGTESLVAIWATISCGLLSPRHRINTIEKTYQLLFVWVGVPLGALMWSQTLPDFHVPDSYGFAYSFIGGFLQIAGSRIANGCTCGHGISGLSELSLQSVFATGAIFGGAIITGFILVGAGEISFP